MTLNQLYTLSDDELAMLLDIANNAKPKILHCEFTERLLCSIKHQKLCELIIKSESLLTDVGRPVFFSLLTKLGVTIVNKPEPVIPSPIPEPTTPEPTTPEPTTPEPTTPEPNV